MNIFVLDMDIEKCANYHNDRHVVKMITEHTQMLSTACRLFGVDQGYRITHINHPCNIWTRTSLDNWLWLRDLTEALHNEWQIRYNHSHNHKAFEVAMGLDNPNISRNGLTKFVQAMPLEYVNVNPIQAYRNYYMGDKRYIASWRNGKPSWWK